MNINFISEQYRLSISEIEDTFKDTAGRCKNFYQKDYMGCEIRDIRLCHINCEPTLDELRRRSGSNIYFDGENKYILGNEQAGCPWTNSRTRILSIDDINKKMTKKPDSLPNSEYCLECYFISGQKYGVANSDSILCPKIAENATLYINYRSRLNYAIKDIVTEGYVVLLPILYYIEMSGYAG